MLVERAPDWVETHATGALLVADDGDQLGQGKENARNFLIENPTMAAEIETKILAKLGIGEKIAEFEPVAVAGPAAAAAKGKAPASAAPVVAEEPALPKAAGA